MNWAVCMYARCVRARGGVGVVAGARHPCGRRASGGEACTPPFQTQLGCQNADRLGDSEMGSHGDEDRLKWSFLMYINKVLLVKL
jgi:hypothetical protein